MDSAKDSFHQKSRTDKRRAKRFKAPDTSKMYGIKVPDKTIMNKYSLYYYTTKKKRDVAFKKYENAVKINPA